MFDETSIPLPDPDKKPHPEMDIESKEPVSQDTLRRLAEAIETKATAGYDARERLRDENAPKYDEVAGDPDPDLDPDEMIGNWFDTLDTRTKDGKFQVIHVKWYTDKGRPDDGHGQRTIGVIEISHTYPESSGADTVKLLQTPDGLAIAKYLGDVKPQTPVSEDELGKSNEEARESLHKKLEDIQKKEAKDQAFQRELGVSDVNDLEARDLAVQIENGTPQRDRPPGGAYE